MRSGAGKIAASSAFGIAGVTKRGETLFFEYAHYTLSSRCFNFVSFRCNIQPLHFAICVSCVSEVC